MMLVASERYHGDEYLRGVGRYDIAKKYHRVSAVRSVEVVRGVALVFARTGACSVGSIAINENYRFEAPNVNETIYRTGDMNCQVFEKVSLAILARGVHRHFAGALITTAYIWTYYRVVSATR